jgi:hypothetical protein
MARAVSKPSAPSKSKHSYIESFAADLRRQYLTDKIHSDVTFDAEQHKGKWGIRVEYLWEDPVMKETRTGSYWLGHSGVRAEADVREVVALLES